MDEILKLALAHKWLAVSVIAIGSAVRLLKSDTKIPIDIPPKYRVWLAMLLGVVSGVMESVSTGMPWKQAILNGLSAAMVAVLGHNVIVDSMRGGKEFAVPWLTIPGAPPSPGKPPSIPPPAPKEAP